MSITLKNGFTPELVNVYNRSLSEPALPYRKLGTEEFCKIFGGQNRLTVAAYDGESPMAFASAALPDAGGRSFLSFIGTLPAYRKSGVASLLLDEVEKQLKEAGAKRIETVFYDSAYLPWLIPGTVDGHPCAPGILSGCDAEKLLLSRGYAEWCAQIAYYLPLEGYEIPARTLQKKQALAAEGIEITLYDPARHHGLETIFDRIGNPGWKKGVMSHLDRPIVVAADQKRGGYVIGYTGPLSNYVEGMRKRGNFCGIGTDPEYRGRGIGTVIFAEMCLAHSRSGADFMSLYTGETMSARRVYEAAGCSATLRFSNLRKTFDEETK